MTDHIISFEQMEFEMICKLSDRLNLSFPELIDLAPKLTACFLLRDYISGYELSFRPGAPVGILNKIIGLSAYDTIYLNFYHLNDLLIDMQMCN